MENCSLGGSDGGCSKGDPSRDQHNPNGSEHSETSLSCPARCSHSLPRMLIGSEEHSLSCQEGFLFQLRYSNLKDSLTHLNYLDNALSTLWTCLYRHPHLWHATRVNNRHENIRELFSLCRYNVCDSHVVWHYFEANFNTWNNSTFLIYFCSLMVLWM